MATASVSFTVPSPAWTGSVTVTDCNLDTDTSVRDFEVFYNGVEQGAVQLALWAKVSSTSLSYSGSALTTGNVVLIRRKTPIAIINSVSPLETISSSLWNAEFDRIVRRDEEFELYGTSLDSIVGVSDEAYASGWNGVTNQAPSKNAVYDKINTLEGTTLPALVSDTAYATSWNGVTTIAPSKNAVYDTIEEHRYFGDMNGRLTVTSGTPVVTSNTSGTTIYYTPYNGNRVHLWNTTDSRWVRYTLSEVSLALGTLTNDVPYDIFLFDNAGTLTLEKVSWTNRTTRATALALQNGVRVKTGELNKRYVGSVASPGSNTVYQGSTNVSTNTSWHNTVFNIDNPLKATLTNTFSVVLTTTGADTRWGSNLSARYLIPVQGFISTSSAYMNASQSSGSNQSIFIALKEDFGTVTVSGDGQVIATTNFWLGSAFGMHDGTVIGLYAWCPYYNISSAHTLGAARLMVETWM